MSAGGPLVSIVIDNHDYEAYLGDAIDGALSQTYPRTEVVVVDDGSTDRSREIIAGYGDQVRAVLKENGGQASAFNAGFEAARGDLICLLDADDFCHPLRAEWVVRAFDRHPRADWIRQRLAVVDADGRPIGPVVPGFRPAGAVRPVPALFMEARVPAITSALSFRRAIGERVFPLPTEVDVGGDVVSLVRDADAFLTARLAAAGGWYASVPDVVGGYRRHDAQQYLGRADLDRMIRRQVAVGRAVAAAFDDVARRDATPTTVFKHRAILAAVEGAPLRSRARLGPALRGWRRAARLLPASPRLALRQALAIAFALFLPGTWTRRLLRDQGFA